VTRMNCGTLAQSIRFGWPCAPGQSLERDQKKRDRDGSLSRRCAEINAPKNEFFQSVQVDLGCPVITRKIFLFTKIGNRVLALPSRAAEGRIAIVTKRGAGLRWTRGALGRSACQCGTAKSCGPDPPTLGSTPGSRARGDGGYQARYPGESTKEPVKTIAQGMSDRSAYLWFLTRVLFLHARPRVCKTPGIPCAL
jgi:hypothetical protein